MTTLHNTIEQGKRLKELGVQYARYHHTNTPYEPDGILRIDVGKMKFPYNGTRIVPALTLGELFAVIDHRRIIFFHKDDIWFVRDWEVEIARQHAVPTHLAADLLIYQLEQGIVTADEVNKKLKNLK